MLKRTLNTLPLVAAVLACLLAGEAVAAVSTTKVSYIAGAMVYADVGSLDGLAAGDTVQVRRAGLALAMVKVAFVSTRRAAFDTLWTRSAIEVGDVMLYTPHVVAAPPVVKPAPPQGLAAALAKQRRPRIRGRVGGRYLSVTTDGAKLQQPALDLRFDGINQGGGHIDVSVDVRSRRTIRTITTTNGTPTNEDISRVYRASLVLRTLDSRRSFSVGRQTSASLASVSLFDGVLAQSGNDRHSFGFFSGNQPDPTSFGLSHEILESGGFVEFHSKNASENRYQFSLGGITSVQGGLPNRDFVFTQGAWSARKLMTSFTQELDINRGWKRTQGEAALTPTSTFWMLRLVPVAGLGLNTGFDNRRNVRLYRDRITPATEFDDAYRQGVWVGSDLELFKRLRMSAETRYSGGADHSRSWSGNAEIFRLTSLHISLRGRSSQFNGPTTTSRVTSGGLGFDPTTASHVEVSGGVRGTRTDPNTTFDNQNWQSVDLDLALGRRWYMNGGYERDYGGSSGGTEQVQGGLSWRF